MKIRTEKKIDSKGNKVRIILGVEGMLGNDKLPAEYIDNTPRVVYESMTPAIVIDGRDRIFVGNEYHEESFQKSMEEMKEAGIRLHMINVRINELKKSWCGEETYVI